MSTLVVVESPAKAKTIGKYLGPAYTVKATVGHIRDLPERALGVDVDDDFRPTFATVKGKAKTITELKKAAKEASGVLIATDPDREGEAIAWHVADQLKAKNVRRVLFHEITKDAIKQAIKQPIEIDDRKVEAQLARRILDRLVGFKVSPLLWKAIKTGLSAGRVQTVALRLIVEREDAIRKFVPQEYWSITARCEHGKHGVRRGAAQGRRPQARDPLGAGRGGDRRRRRRASRSSSPRCKRKERRKHPAGAVHDQHAAAGGRQAARLQLPAHDAAGAAALRGRGGRRRGLGRPHHLHADRLHPGRALGGRGGAAVHRRALSGQSTCPRRPTSTARARTRRRRTRTRPSGRRTSSGRRRSVRRHLTKDQFRLYQLVWQRFVASQMAPTVYDTTTLDFEIGRYLFRATGSVILFDGYHRLYHEARETGRGPHARGPGAAAAARGGRRG